MPVYEYLCHDCKRVTEDYMENMDPKKYVRCQHCGRRATKIIGNTGGFILKGPGWPGKELSQGEVMANEAKRDKEFKSKRRDLRREGAPFKYWGDE